MCAFLCVSIASRLASCVLDISYKFKSSYFVSTSLFWGCGRFGTVQWIVSAAIGSVTRRRAKKRTRTEKYAGTCIAKQKSEEQSPQIEFRTRFRASSVPRRGGQREAIPFLIRLQGINWSTPLNVAMYEGESLERRDSYPSERQQRQHGGEQSRVESIVERHITREL